MCYQNCYHLDMMNCNLMKFTAITEKLIKVFLLLRLKRIRHKKRTSEEVLILNIVARRGIEPLLQE